MENQRNLVLAIALSLLVLVGWTFLSQRYLPQPASPPSTKIVDGKSVPLPKPEAAPDSAAQNLDRNVVLRASPRVAIRTPALAGSRRACPAARLCACLPGTVITGAHAA